MTTENDKIKGLWRNKKSQVFWKVNFIFDDGSDDIVIVKTTGKPLTKIINKQSLLKNWERQDYGTLNSLV